MRSGFSFRLVRLWPLSLSALALAIFMYFFPTFCEAFLYSWAGSHTIGWYSDFGPDYSPDGRPYFFYAYKVGNNTYGGRGLYDDDTSASDIYFRHVGDPIGVSYLRRKPWVSTIKPVQYNFTISCWSLGILAIAFISGIGLSALPVTQRESTFILAIILIVLFAAAFLGVLFAT